jgi:hypothetical protein
MAVRKKQVSTCALEHVLHTMNNMSYGGDGCAAIAICSTSAPVLGTAEFLADACCMPLATALASQLETMPSPIGGGGQRRHPELQVPPKENQQRC